MNTLICSFILNISNAFKCEHSSKWVTVMRATRRSAFNVEVSCLHHNCEPFSDVCLPIPLPVWAHSKGEQRWEVPLWVARWPICYDASAGLPWQALRRALSSDSKFLIHHIPALWFSNDRTLVSKLVIIITIHRTAKFAFEREGIGFFFLKIFLGNSNDKKTVKNRIEGTKRMESKETNN